MDKDNNILDKIGHKDGFSTPENYFDDFAEKMMSQLPERPELESPAPVRKRTFWQAARPYVYMAAMFAGIWLMLKMFVMMGSAPSSSLSIDEHPSLARCVQDADFVEDYVITDVSDWDIYNELVEDSIDVYNLMDSIYNTNPEPALPAEAQDQK